MSSVIGPPEGFCLDLSLRVKSGLIAFQLWPLSVDLKTFSAAEYNVFGSCGETNKGEVQLKRYGSFSAPLPETSRGSTEISTTCSVRLSKRVIKPSASAKTMLGSGG